ncbi:hypothetical protein Aduo_018749 [Ancylostoma duodenale]
MSIVLSSFESDSVLKLTYSGLAMEFRNHHGDTDSSSTMGMTQDRMTLHFGEITMCYALAAIIVELFRRCIVVAVLSSPLNTKVPPTSYLETISKIMRDLPLQ